MRRWEVQCLTSVSGLERLCYEIPPWLCVPPPAVTSTLPRELYSLPKQPGQIQAAVIRPQRSTLEHVSIQPGGLHTGEKHPRTSDPSQRLTPDSGSRRVPFPLLWHCIGNKYYVEERSSGNKNSTRNDHKTLEQKLSILLQNQNQTDAFQSNKQCHRQKCAGKA